MKIGVCAPPQYWAAVKELGYDHVEWNFSVIANYTEEQMAYYLAQKDEQGVQILACNGFFPGGFAMFGENRDEIEAWTREYARAGFARAAQFGAEVAVMGSGYARNIPEGMDKAEAKQRFAALMRILGEEGERAGVRVAIEPLQVKETNFLHTLEEGAEICAMVNHPYVGLTLDVFHFWAGGEPIQNIEKYKQYVFHAHLARPQADRKAPTEADLADCLVYRDAMRAIGYDGKISLEPVYGDFSSDIAGAYPVMKHFR